MPYWVLGILLICMGCSNSSSSSDNTGYTYVKPSVDKNGRYRKGHVRAKVSLKKDAIKNQNRSRYYYHTRKKSRR